MANNDTVPFAEPVAPPVLVGSNPPIPNRAEPVASPVLAGSGALIANPAEPAAPTKAPPVVDNSSLINRGAVGVAAPVAKTLYHPVHGAVIVKDANEEASLSPRTDYFNTPEEADMHRTATEAWTTYAFNQAEKLRTHAEAGHQVVRNSVQSDMSLRSGAAVPL